MRSAVKGDLILVDVPEWGEKVYIRKLSVGDQLELSRGTEDAALLGVKVLLHSICDENGDRQLTDDDLPLLLEQDFTTLMPLLTESAKHNGMTEQELKDAIASFGKTPGKDSPSE